MKLDAGILKIYSLINRASLGDKPREALLYKSQHWYGEKTVGVTRHYAALQVNEKIDFLVRVWYTPNISTSQYCILQDCQQFRILQIQSVTDEDTGLRALDISLERLGDNFELTEA